MWVRIPPWAQDSHAPIAAEVESLTGPPRPHAHAAVGCSGRPAPTHCLRRRRATRNADDGQSHTHPRGRIGLLTLRAKAARHGADGHGGAPATGPHHSRSPRPSPDHSAVEAGSAKQPAATSWLHRSLAVGRAQRRCERGAARRIRHCGVSRNYLQRHALSVARAHGNRGCNPRSDAPSRRRWLRRWVWRRRGTGGRCWRSATLLQASPTRLRTGSCTCPGSTRRTGHSGCPGRAGSSWKLRWPLRKLCALPEREDWMRWPLSSGCAHVCRCACTHKRVHALDA